jgi:hypothetical protein
MQGHDRTGTKPVKVGWWKRGIVHHIQVQAWQDQRKSDLLDKQLICTLADDRIERVLKRYKIWMYLACKEEDVSYMWFGLLKEEQMFGDFCCITKNPGLTSPDRSEVNPNTQFLHR